MQPIGSVAKATHVDGRQRLLDREDARATAALNARRAQEARAARDQRSSLVNRVETAKEALTGRSVADSIALIERVRPLDRDVWLIAETEGAARPSVLRTFGPIRKEVQARYLAESGAESAPEQTA